MLLVTVVNMDASNTWGVEHVKRPRWLRVMLEITKAHVRKHGHAMALRWKPTQPQLTEWQIEACHREKAGDGECVKRNERENINWEKHLMLSDYLHSPANFSHVMMMDADAIFTRADADSMSSMAKVLEEKAADLFTASEDWMKHGEERINGGVLLAKNTKFTGDLFQDLWECHRAKWVKSTRTLVDGPIQCSSNEMVGLNDWRSRRGMAQKIHLASGRYWNRGGEVLFALQNDHSDARMHEQGLKDPEMEIIHFVGGTKNPAGDVLCRSFVDLTGENASAYACGAS